MQVSDANPMVGLEGRSSLLANLSKALLGSNTYFGAAGRPGHIVGVSSAPDMRNVIISD